MVDGEGVYGIKVPPAKTDCLFMLVHPGSWAFTPAAITLVWLFCRTAPPAWQRGSALEQSIGTGFPGCWHGLASFLSSPGTHMVVMPQLNLSGAWRGGCHPPVLGRENYLQGERSCLIRCWAHAGASSCCLQFTSGEAVTLPLPMGSRNSWSIFQSKHDPQHLTARAVEKPTLAPLLSLPGLQLPQLQDFLLPPWCHPWGLYCCSVPLPQ